MPALQRIKDIKVLTYVGRHYTTPKGLTIELAKDFVWNFLIRQKNPEKYGAPYWGGDQKLWGRHYQRLRRTYYRRAIPIIKKLFGEG